MPKTALIYAFIFFAISAITWLGSISMVLHLLGLPVIVSSAITGTLGWWAGTWYQRLTKPLVEDIVNQ